jgi:hypothetical protein
MARAGNPRELIAWLQEQPEDKVFEVKERRNRRSLTANAYYWSMLNQLARTLGISNTECHMKMLRDYGVSDVMLLRDDINPADYFVYYDEYDAGRIKGVKYKRVTAYKRSSQMDSKEFSSLVDGLRYECESQGIPFMTPEETARLHFEQPDRS